MTTITTAGIASAGAVSKHDVQLAAIAGDGRSSDSQGTRLPLERKTVSLRRLELADSVGLALALHPEIGRATAAIGRSDAEVSVAQAAWYPKIGYTSNLAASQTTSTSSASSGGSTMGIEATQLIYDFGRAQSDLDVAQATRSQREAELRDIQERVALQTSEAYLEVARATNLVGAADRYLESLNRLHGVIKLRASSGAADQADVYFADVRLQSAYGDKIRSQARMSTAASRLSRVLGVRVQTVSDPSAAVGAVMKASGGGDGVIGLAAAESAAAAARARISGARANFYPSINLKGSQSFGVNDPAHDSTSQVGLSIQGDLFSGGATQGRLEAAQKEAQAAERTIATTRLASNTEVDTAKADMISAAERKVVFSRQATMARQSRDIYLDEYQIGKRTLTEVLNAEQEIYRADAEQINANADAWGAVVRSAAARAQLVASLTTLSRH